MLIEKVLQVSLDLYLSAEIYASDKPSLIINKLNKIYVGRCYQAMLIKKIVKIIDYSDTVMDQKDLSGRASIDVKFIALGIVFLMGEVVSKVKIIARDPVGVIVQNDYVNGTMPHNANIVHKSAVDLYPVGSDIPVIVQAARYGINTESITVSTLPFMPYKYHNLTHKITSKLNLEEIGKLRDTLTSYDKFVSQLDTEHKSFRYFFELMYPFQTTQKYAGKKIKLDLDTFDYIDQYICSPIEDYKSSDKDLLIFQVESPTDYILSTAYSALVEIINKRKLYLHNINQMATMYNTPTAVQTIANYIAIYKSKKF